MKILFINPPYTNFEGIAGSAGHMMPLCFGYLAAYTRQRIEGLEFVILDTEALGLNYSQIESEIKALAPDIVGLTVPTPTMKHVVNISNIVKKVNPDTFVVLGGIHPSVFPVKTLEECRSADVVFIGESELSFHDLVINIRSGDKDFSKIPGICYRIHDTPQTTSQRKLIESLDDLPFPARDLYDLNLYRSAPTKKVSDEQATPILTSRGCPYECIHCPSKNIWGRRIRFRSANNVVDEIEECVTRYNFREFNFFDDAFTINKSRAIAVCREIIKRNLSINWICFSRVNSIDDELVECMKTAGCKKISFGLESGDQNVLNLMNKETSVDVMKKAVKIVRSHNVDVHASFMLGNLGETKESIERTIGFANSLDLDNATFFITTPFPGTDLYSIAVTKGYINDDTKWEYFAPLTNSSPVLVQENLSAKELISAQKRAFRSFYLRPKYVLNKISKNLSIKGIYSLLEGFLVFMKIQRK